MPQIWEEAPLISADGDDSSSHSFSKKSSPWIIHERILPWNDSHCWKHASSERCEAFTRPLLCCIMCLEPTCRCSWMNESLRPALVSSPSLIAAPSARLKWCWQRKIKTHVLKEQSCDWHLEIIPAFVSCPGWWDHGAGHPPVFLTSPPCWWGLSQWADELSPRTIWITRAYMSEISQHSGSPGGSETLHLQSCAQAASNVLVPTFLPFWAIDPPRSLSLKQLMVCCCWNKVLPPNVL